ncbi:MAG TPA: PilZ domain-containing protein [Nitrospira sp.]|nr:PilZ domain-containing protein [Nitrospira sp.]
MKPRYKDRLKLESFGMPSVIFTVGSKVGEGRLRDITIPGCLIQSPMAVQKEESVQLKLFLPGVKSPLSVSLGVVRWTKGTLFGVEFIKMDASHQQLLASFLAQHGADAMLSRATKNTFSDPGGQNWHLKTFSCSSRR